MEDNELQLQIKKRARRRLVGAIFFVSLVALVLPALMDQEPRQAAQDVEIRIPGQDEKPFSPKVAAAPPAKAAPAVAPPPVQSVAEPTARVLSRTTEKESKAHEAENAAEKTPARPEKAPEKGIGKEAEKIGPKAAEKAAEKAAAEKAAEKERAEDARRAAAILAGKPVDAAKPAARAEGKAGEYLVLIGAFSNEANVRNIRSKLGELGIKTFSEPLESPQGTKTRVRAGPFPNREAAEKALEKMRRVGVSGLVAPKP